MKQRVRCSVCSHPEKDAIDTALLAQTSERSVATTFQLGRQSVQRHANNHLSTPAVQERIKRSRSRAKLAMRIDAIDQQIGALSSADDVLAEIRRLYGVCQQLLAFAMKTGDTRLSERLIGQCGALLDKLAKSFNLFSDNANITINSGEQKVMQVFSGMTEAQIRAIAEAESEPARLSA